MADVVIEAQGLSKTFNLPLHRVDSLKERVAHPLTKMEYRELTALREVSFEVRQGEFFGIVGRNGSGKSTLLKILASIYRADRGRVRMAGRLAPFIELGVGFDPELSGAQNAVLNGVLMGLTRKEARRRTQAIIEFADLEEFAELKLKNYSSGMMVRLAFAVMVQADADIMVVDEVLAVGDAAFARKCLDVFGERRSAGKTIVLVTHDMDTVQSMCDRAMLLHEGEVRHLGAPEEVARQYYRLNFVGSSANVRGQISTARADLSVTVHHSQLLDPRGRPTTTLDPGEPIRLSLRFGARRELVEPTLVVHVRSAEGSLLHGLEGELAGVVELGERVRVEAELDNRLAPGAYSLDFWVRSAGEEEYIVQGIRLMDFAVDGEASPLGLVAVDGEMRAQVEPPVRP